ncbi:hypothetical protein FEM48_Zijuj05G0180200 [Ziziphus jujuba var. spinosa]|uniref:Uncharacterized protein n=1 Tax=Ziziphus jujuba var. spinosa TaxID=714518 RepID=A0A978VGB1_ZIZJJ|nr:hypothetical protein FEM48_Zijuj05G0180200 [Ziziphus jujuba var. spinosa]
MDQSEGMGSNTNVVAGNFNSMGHAKSGSEILVKEILSPLEKENDYTTSNSSAEEGKGSLPILENVLCMKESPPGAEYCKVSTSNTEPADSDVEDEKVVQTLLSDKLDTCLSLSGVNPLPCGALIIQMENQKESPKSVMLWWTMYQVPFYYLPGYNQTAVETVNSCVDERMKHKERSCSDSNEG